MCKIKQMIGFQKAWLLNCELLFFPPPYLIYLEIGIDVHINH